MYICVAATFLCNIFYPLNNQSINVFLPFLESNEDLIIVVNELSNIVHKLIEEYSERRFDTSKGKLNLFHEIFTH